MLAFIIILTQLTPAQAIEDLQRELDRAQRVVAVMEAETTGRHLRPAAKPKIPWALQAQIGQASWHEVGARFAGTFPSVGPSTPMSFRVFPRMGTTAPSMEVEICRGSLCHEASWPWRCHPSGRCEVEGIASNLLGSDAGAYSLAFSIRASAGTAAQTWEFTAAP